MLSTHCRLRKRRAFFTTHSYVGLLSLRSFTMRRMKRPRKDGEHSIRLCRLKQQSLLKFWPSWSKKLRWSTCCEPGAYQIMDSSQYCNRAPPWKGLHWISEPAPQYTHRYLSTYLLFGERVISVGNKGMEETEYVAYRTGCSQESYECCKAEVFGAPALPGGVRGGGLRAFFKWKSVGKKSQLKTG